MTKLNLKASLISAAKRSMSVPAPKAAPKAKAIAKDDALAIPAFLDAKNPKRRAEIAANSKRPAQSVRAINASKVSAPKAKAPKTRKAPEWFAALLSRASSAKGVTRRDMLEITGRPQVTPKMQISALAKREGKKFWQREIDGVAHYGIA